jgi:hypothetical protein
MSQGKNRRLKNLNPIKTKLRIHLVLPTRFPVAARKYSSNEEGLI